MSEDHSTADPRFDDIPLSEPSDPNFPLDTNEQGTVEVSTTDRLQGAIRNMRSSGSVTGLSASHRIRARDLTMEAAYLAWRHSPSIHYTQGWRRWDGISKHLKAWKGNYPNYADCSSFATWCIWNGLDHYDVRDTVNGLNWRAGYTGTMLTHGKRVWSQSNVLRGDCAIYGRGFPGKHTAICIGGGLAISHGNEAGPVKVRINYRSDLMQIRRYI